MKENSPARERLGQTPHHGPSPVRDERTARTGSGFRSEYVVGLANRTLKLARATIIEDFFALHADALEEVGIEPLLRKPKWWNEMLKQDGL